MFFWVLFIVTILTLLGLIFLNGLAISRSSGPPPTPTNWWMLIGIAFAHGLLWALVLQGFASLFSGG